MANRSGLLEKEAAAFAGTQHPGVRINHSSPNQAFTAVKQPEVDELLEDTLLNVKLVEPLTKREEEILRLIIAGETNKKIAQKLYRAERTIEYHRHRLMRKLDAHNAAGLIKKAIALKLV